MSSVTIQMDDPPLKLAYVPLNLEDNLSEIRNKLENHSVVKMDNMLSFARKGYEIAHEDEVGLRLRDIIDSKGIVRPEYTLLLIESSSKSIWKFLNDKCKLDYGRTMTNDGIKKAENRAFEMNNCESTQLGAEGCRCGKVKFNLEKVEDWVMKTNLFVNTDDKIQHFVKLGLSVGTLKKEKFKSKTDLSYHYRNYGKLLLEFSKYLEPTAEFINAVENVIESGNPGNFISITEKFGQFIPTEVILGGRVHFEDYKRLAEDSISKVNGIAMDLDVLNITETKITHSSGYTKGNTKYYEFNDKNLIGGEQPENFENFDEAAEKTWVKSLKYYKNWDCIEFRNPISVFQLLSDDLRKRIFSLVGKKILHSKIEYFDYWLNENNKPNIFELKNIPLDISKSFRSKEADCNIFATVVDTKESKNDFFICQILCPPNGKPRLIIHCVQKKSLIKKQHKYKLKISWMVVGHDIDFNFILSDSDVQLKF